MASRYLLQYSYLAGDYGFSTSAREISTTKNILRADPGFLMMVLLIQCLSGSCQWHASPFLLLSSSMSISSVFALAFFTHHAPTSPSSCTVTMGFLGNLDKNHCGRVVFLTG